MVTNPPKNTALMLTVHRGMLRLWNLHKGMQLSKR